MAVLTADEVIDQALAHHAGGRVDEAEAGLRFVLTVDPDNADALNLLGLLLQEKGQYQDSIALLSRALAVDAAFPEALTNLARVQRVVGDPAAAIQSAKRALQLDPDLAEATLQLASSLLDLQRGADAERILRHSLKRHSMRPEAALMLGNALFIQDKYGDALAEFEIVLQRDPNHVEAIVKAGVSLGHLNRLDEALTHHKHAVDLAPAVADTHAALALTCRQRQDPFGSAAACRDGLKIAPERADLWLLLAGNLAFAGRFDEAAVCHERALSLNPQSAEVWRDRAMIGQLAGTEDIIRLQGILADPQARGAERVAAGFSLGRLLDKANAFDAAFTAYAAANQLVHQDLRQSGNGFDLASLHRHIDWLIETFSHTLFERGTSLGDLSEHPVFIVGMPRSGTTLVEQIAASHAQVFGAGERKDIHELVCRLSGDSLQASPLDWAPDAIRVQVREHIARLTALGDGAARVIDKMPDNIQFLGHIAVLFPNARIILCRRDLRDICLSAFFQQFDDNMNWTSDLADCAARAQEIERLIAHWQAVVPLRILEVSYEDLVTDLEGQSRRLIAFLGLDWDPACLAFHQTQRPVMTASYWQVRQPLYAASRGRWQHYQRHLATLLLGLTGLVPLPESEDWDWILGDPDAAIRAAAIHRQAGRLAVAEEIYQQLLRRHPDYPVALHLQALLTHGGDAADRIGSGQEPACLRPDVSALLIDLARGQRAAGCPSAAVRTLERGLALDDAWPDGHAEMGLVLLALGQLERAQDHTRRALELDPDSPDACFAQARILAAQGQPDRAEHLWRRLLDLRPTDLELLNGLTEAIAALGRYDEAIQNQRRTIETFPDNPLLLYQLAWLLWRSQDPASAIEVCEAGIVLVPDRTEIWLLLANCRMLIGDFDVAVDCYRHALGLDPASGAAFAGLMQAGGAKQADDVFVGSTAIMAKVELPIDQRVAAAFAVARYHETCKNYDAAFAGFAAANALAQTMRVQKASGDSLLSLQRYVDWAIQTFRKETFHSDYGFANNSELPAYIAGMARSGTTLVEQIAASHHSVFGEGERADLELHFGSAQGGQLFVAPEDWDVGFVRARTDDLLTTLRQRGGDAVRVINKLPNNILWLGQISLLFPKAKIIICRRDLRDVCLSCYSQNFFDPDMAWTDTLDGCAMQAREIDRLLHHWRSVLPTPPLEIQYETLVADLEGESRRLIDHLDIEWDPACLTFHNTRRAVMTASNWQVRQPLYSTSVGKWRYYRRDLGPLFKALQGLIPEND